MRGAVRSAQSRQRFCEWHQGYAGRQISGDNAERYEHAGANDSCSPGRMATAGAYESGRRDRFCGRRIPGAVVLNFSRLCLILIMRSVSLHVYSFHITSAYNLRQRNYEYTQTGKF
jgi:hypothetical protein